MSNKDRVFVAVYAPRNPPSVLSSSSRPSPSSYTWGIWIEPKLNPTTSGTSFDLDDAPSFASTTNPFGWRLHIDTHKAPPERMLGRVMIGKLVEGMSTADVAALLREVGGAVQDGVGWVKEAVRALQEVECAERFSTDQMVDDVVGMVAGWVGKGDGKRELGGEKVNYTWSRTFP